MSTELIRLTDDPYKNYCDSDIDRQEISLIRFCGSGNMRDRLCLNITVRRDGSNDGECIYLTRSQATVLRDILDQEIVEYNK